MNQNHNLYYNNGRNASNALISNVHVWYGPTRPTICMLAMKMRPCVCIILCVTPLLAHFLRISQCILVKMHFVASEHTLLSNVLYGICVKSFTRNWNAPFRYDRERVDINASHLTANWTNCIRFRGFPVSELFFIVSPLFSSNITPSAKSDEHQINSP